MVFSMAEIETRQFRIVKKGYDPEEVQSYLRLVAVDVNGDLVAADSMRQAAARQLEGVEGRIDQAQAEATAARATTERVLAALRLAEEARDAEAARAERIEREREVVEAALLGAEKLCPQCERSGHDIATMLHTASETANATVEQAENDATERRREADEYADIVRADAEAYANATRAEADAYANVTRSDADDYATKVRATAHYEGQASLAAIEAQAKATVEHAEAEAHAIRQEAERYAAAMIADLDALQRQTEQEAQSLIERAKKEAGHGEDVIHLESFDDGSMADSW
jgi:DivIVA domain-containing protein